MTSSSRRPERTSRRCALVLAALGVLASTASAVRAADSACQYLTRTISGQPGPALLLASYPAAEPGPLRQVAFLYDNAAAAIALVGCGQSAQAQRIGDALLLALEHDRYWHDGRLRNGYAAGPVDGSSLRLAGWWDASNQRWLEDNYQAGSDSGNLAWAMLALLTLDGDSRPRRRPDQAGRYTQGALRIAQWLEKQRDSRGQGGFTGGSFGPESAPQRLLWKSTEHNVDLAAAFSRLALASAEPHWQRPARAAAHFVEAMWYPQRGAFAAGTSADGVTRNPLLALDAQVWPLLALPGAALRYAEVLSLALPRIAAASGGYAYSEAGGGTWTEGTAQVLLLRRRLQLGAPEGRCEAAIEAARAPDGGYYATTVAALPTGFMLDTAPGQPRVYQHLEHLGAAAWVALAEQGFDPFTAARSLPPH
jgi:hypothetical protein